MRFFVVENDTGTPVACELTRAEADARASELCPIGHTIVMVDAPVTTGTVRRLLGGLGGYATNIRVVYPKNSEGF